MRSWHGPAGPPKVMKTRCGKLGLAGESACPTSAPRGAGAFACQPNGPGVFNGVGDLAFSSKDYLFAPTGQFTTTVSIGDSADSAAGVRMRKRLPSGLGT